MRVRHPDCVFTAQRDVGRVTVIAEAPPQEVSELPIILDDKDPHAPPNRASREVKAM